MKLLPTRLDSPARAARCEVDVMEMAKTHSDDERSAEKLRDQKTVEKAAFFGSQTLYKGALPRDMQGV
jgi:hypothetical protein